MRSIGESNFLKKFENAKCIVIKIGSSLLVDENTGTLRLQWLESLAQDVYDLKKMGKEVVLVSSGSIALGRRILELPTQILELDQSQAAASVGQIQLAQAYQKSLSKYGITTGQVLVTAEDSQNRRRYLNSRATLATLLRMDVVPIVNENDTVATDDIRFGDNDRLAAQVASLCDADILIILSDVDGLYTSNPLSDKSAKHIPIVSLITPEIVSYAGNSTSQDSKGGMITKIDAARVAMAAGCILIITKGKSLRPINRLQVGASATWFIPEGDAITARKKWISAMKVKGRLYIDSGAEKALENGKSLLPVGLINYDGDFQRGDTVEILSFDGRSLAKGLVAYNEPELSLIKGCHSREIKDLLGHAGRSALVHRNDMTK